MRPPPRRARASLAALLGAAALAMALAGCGSGVRAPAEGAARVVPAGALAYLHLSLDPGDGAVAALRSRAERLPGYAHLLRGLQARLGAIAGADYASRIRPWLGSEVAVAFLAQGDSASELIVLGVRDRRAARAFVATAHAASTRLVDGYVVLGEPGAVARAGRGTSLAQNAGFQTAMAAAPRDRVLEAYGTGAGLDELLAGRRGTGGLATTLLSLEHPRTVELALAPSAHGARIWARLTGPGQGGGTRFSPSLASRLPADTAWVAQVPSLVGSGPGLLEALAAASGTGASPVSRLVSRLGPALSSEGVDPSNLARLFSGPSAIFDVDGDVGVMADTADATAARRELGVAGGALAELFASAGAGTAPPLVSTVSENGVPVVSYQQPTGTQLDLAVSGHLIVLTTSLGAMREIFDRKNALSASTLYRSVLAGSGPAVGPVLFGAINRLVRSGAVTGLLQSLGLAGARPALDRIGAAGLITTAGTSQTTSELFLTIS